MFAGFVCSFVVPALHHQSSLTGGMKRSLLGIAFGAGLIYFILRGFKLVFGRHKLALAADTRLVFTETSVHLPENEEIPYEDVFYRRSDTIRLQAKTLELVDRCYQNVLVRLSPNLLRIGEEKLNPEEVPHMEAVTSELVLPREVMGLGDVKFMAAIGAFLGWKAVFFSLVVSSFVGAAVGLTLVFLGRREMGSRLPYGPYIAVGAALWIFAGPELVRWYQHLVLSMLGR
jgi:leader peptidase (prepilin peptidase)/N-methyltransferase